MVFEVVMLICTLVQTPTPAECNEKTAVHVMKDEREFSSMQSCYLYAYHRTIPLVLNMGDDAFSKVQCRGERGV